jgi:hypothetical protein
MAYIVKKKLRSQMFNAIYQQALRYRGKYRPSAATAWMMCATISDFF